MEFVEIRREERHTSSGDAISIALCGFAFYLLKGISLIKGKMVYLSSQLYFPDAADSSGAAVGYILTAETSQRQESGHMVPVVQKQRERNGGVLTEVSVLPGPAVVQSQRNTQRSTLIIN